MAIAAGGLQKWSIPEFTEEDITAGCKRITASDFKVGGLKKQRRERARTRTTVNHDRDCSFEGTR